MWNLNYGIYVFLSVINLIYLSDPFATITISSAFLFNSDVFVRPGDNCQRITDCRWGSSCNMKNKYVTNTNIYKINPITTKITNSLLGNKEINTLIMLTTSGELVKST